MLVHALVWGLWLYLFWPLLGGQSQLGFRDSASLYQPLFEWTRDQWLHGQIPFWCAQDNWGGPVVADATASVFYPGKLIFLAAFIPFPVLFGFYVSVHVLLAVYAARWCASAFCRSVGACWLAGIAYGFGGSLLFQTCNVVFLVGAAWLPIATGFIWRFARTGQWKLIPGLAVSMALMVLGGDPQMAFHVALIAGVTWGLSVVAGVAATDHGLGWADASKALVTVVVLAVLLSAIQVLPSLEWAGTSERATIPASGSLGDLLRRPVPGSHRDAIYQFSLPPWSVCELLWPNILGKFDFARNWRWSSSLAGADRVWTGSIYLGSVVFLLALPVLFQRRKEAADHFLTGMLCFFLMASFGWFGIGWLVHELQLMRGGSGTAMWFGEPTGGVYWWMEQLIPGYSGFRYPAKLSVVAVLAFCLLGGRGFDRLLNSELNSETTDGKPFQKRVSHLVAVVLVLTLLLAAIGVFVRFCDSSQLLMTDDNAFREVLSAFSQTGLVLLLFGGLLFCWQRGHLKKKGFIRATLILCSVELVVAVGWTVATVPLLVTTPDEPDSGETVLLDAAYRGQGLEDIRYFEDWEDLPVQLDIDRQTLVPKHHLLTSRRLIGSFHSIQPLDLTLLLRMIDGLSREERDRVLSALSVSHQVEFGEPGRFSKRKASFRKIEKRERFYFSAAIECWPEIDPASYSDVFLYTQKLVSRIALAADARIDENPVRKVFVECDPSLVQDLNGNPDTPGSVALVSETPTRIRLRVGTHEKSLLVASEYYNENWQAWKIEASGERQRLPIIRTNRVLRGIVVPPGNYELEMTYHPSRFYWGAWISCLVWGLLVCLLTVNRLRRASRLPGHHPAPPV